jgi:quinol monooxygenase YgiN
MFIVVVNVHVTPDGIDTFREATLTNARASWREPGIVRFDFIQQRDEPTRFLLIEVYRDEAAAAAHKETAHYKVWRDAVAPFMASPRVSQKYTNLAPADTGWEMPSAARRG